MILLLSTSSASGQTCEAPRICATQELLDDAVEKKATNICAKAMRDAPRYRSEAVKERKRADQCEGKLSERPKTMEKMGAPLWLRLATPIALAATGTATGAFLGSGAPVELAVGTGVAAGLLFVAELLIEILF